MNIEKLLNRIEQDLAHIDEQSMCGTYRNAEGNQLIIVGKEGMFILPDNGRGGSMEALPVFDEAKWLSMHPEASLENTSVQPCISTEELARRIDGE